MSTEEKKENPSTEEPKPEKKEKKSKKEKEKASGMDPSRKYDRVGLENVMKRRFFVVPAFEIYNGVAGLYDYGPTGCQLKNHIENYWREHFILEESLLEISATCLTPEIVLKTSGHVEKFTDFAVKDVKTGQGFRCDKLIQEWINKEKKKKKINIFVKILIYIIYLIVLFIQAVTYLINHTHYLYQLIFTLCISLILLCIMIDLDIIIHNFIFKSLKNIYKSRKYKMKIFFYVLGMSLSAVLMLFFIEDLNLNEIKRNLNDSGNCKNFDIENFGTMKSFLDIDYIFYIIGSFWGASFTIEYNIEKWWDDKFINSFIKILVSILLNILLILINKLFTSLAYEILFLIQCFSYFIRGYLIFGILPYIFQKSKKNKEIDENNLFKTSIFYSENIPKNYIVVDYNEKLINEEKKMNKEEEKNKKNKSNLYSSLVSNVKKHTSEDGLEFTLKENKQEISPQSANIPLFKEDDLNN